MTQARLIPVASRDEWNEALKGVPHSYWHSWAAHNAITRGTGRPTFLFVHDDPESGGRAACPFAEREWEVHRDIYTATGFAGFAASGSCSNARSEWEAMVRERGYVCGYFAIHPCVGHVSLHSSVQPSHPLYILDLENGAEAALARASRSVHRSMADWREQGQHYLFDRSSISSFLLEHCDSFMDRLGATRTGRWANGSLESMLADPDLLMVGAADEHGICAAHTFALGNVGAEAHLNVSIRDGRAFTTALIVWGIHETAAKGARWIALGGGSSPGDSVAKSKEKYRPSTRVLQIAHEIYDADMFHHLCRATSAPADSVAFFPPYRYQLAT
jgi:hypothetical protein